MFKMFSAASQDPCTAQSMPKRTRPATKCVPWNELKTHNVVIWHCPCQPGGVPGKLQGNATPVGCVQNDNVGIIYASLMRLCGASSVHTCDD